MGADHQSTEIEVNGIRMYLNLWLQDKEIGSRVMPKGTWHFMTAYRSGLTDQQRQWIAKKTDGMLARYYPTEEDAKDAVRIMIRKLEANSNGWGDGFSGMPDFYCGPRRKIAHE